MAISTPVRELWEANNKVNANLLNHLTQDMMHARTPGGGMSVADHLAELTGTTEFWVSRLAGDRLRETPRTYEIVDDEVIAFTDVELFRERMPLSRAAVFEAADAVGDGETGDVPHTSADAVLLHMIVHDSHHRGQLLLALKTNGFGLPPEEAMWLPWRNEPWP
mgnify:CR=1 FL=1